MPDHFAIFSRFYSRLYKRVRHAHLELNDREWRHIADYADMLTQRYIRRFC